MYRLSGSQRVVRAAVLLRAAQVSGLRKKHTVRPALSGVPDVLNFISPDFSIQFSAVVNLIGVTSRGY